MLTIRRTILAIFILMLSGHLVGQGGPDQAEELWPEITRALGDGDARGLAAHFSHMVDLGLPEKDDSFSKSQGELIMRDFFKKCPPVNLDVDKKGIINEKLHFAICTYHAKDARYQVSIHLQREDESFRITKIKFEKQDESP